MITDYGKFCFQSPNGELIIAQPKSFTKATSREKDELVSLLFRGKYMLIMVAMPADTLKGEKE